MIRIGNKSSVSKSQKCTFVVTVAVVQCKHHLWTPWAELIIKSCDVMSRDLSFFFFSSNCNTLVHWLDCTDLNLHQDPHKLQQNLTAQSSLHALCLIINSRLGFGVFPKRLFWKCRTPIQHWVDPKLEKNVPNLSVPHWTHHTSRNVQNG